MSQFSKEQLLKLFENSPELLKELEGISTDDIPAILIALKEKGQLRPPSFSSPDKNSSYYKERFALDLKKVLDLLINSDGTFKTSVEPCFDYSKMNRVNKNSLYNRIVMSWKFLNDFLDPTGNYKKLREMLVPRKEAKGIFLRWKITSRFHYSMEQLSDAVVITDSKEEIEWRNELDEFIKTAKNNSIFKKHNLLLTPGQIKIIEGLVSDLPGFFIIELNRNKITIAYNESIQSLERFEPIKEEDDNRGITGETSE